MSVTKNIAMILANSVNNNGADNIGGRVAEIIMFALEHLTFIKKLDSASKKPGKRYNKKIQRWK